MNPVVVKAVIKLGKTKLTQLTKQQAVKLVHTQAANLTKLSQAKKLTDSTVDKVLEIRKVSQNASKLTRQDLIKTLTESGGVREELLNSPKQAKPNRLVQAVEQQKKRDDRIDNLTKKTDKWQQKKRLERDYENTRNLNQDEVIEQYQKKYKDVTNRVEKLGDRVPANVSEQVDELMSPEEFSQLPLNKQKHELNTIKYVDSLKGTTRDGIQLETERGIKTFGKIYNTASKEQRNAMWREYGRVKEEHPEWDSDQVMGAITEKFATANKYTEDTGIPSIYEYRVNGRLEMSFTTDIENAQQHAMTDAAHKAKKLKMDNDERGKVLGSMRKIKSFKRY